MAGDPVRRLTQALGELREQLAALVSAVRARPGAPVLQRVRALAGISAGLLRVRLDSRAVRSDPVVRQRARLPADVAEIAEGEARAEVTAALDAVLARLGEAGP